MASLFSSHCLCFLVLLFSCLLIVPSFASSFHSIYFFGDIGDSRAADHIASNFNLTSPQPYTQQGTGHYECLSFATPGATIMSPLFFLNNGILPPPQSHDLSQIATFMEFFHKYCTSFHDSGKNKILQNTVIFMDQPGINDYKHAFLHGKSISEVSYLVPEVVETIKNSVERLVNEAGSETTIMVSGSLPMGCFPGYRTMFPEGDKNRSICHEELNMFSKLHNDHLRQALEELQWNQNLRMNQDPQLKYPVVEIVYADYYNAFRTILKSHVMFGFKTETLMKACCGCNSNGPFNFDMQNKCGEEGAVACSDSASYIHWDGFRLTPEAWENLIDTLFRKNDPY